MQTSNPKHIQKIVFKNQAAEVTGKSFVKNSERVKMGNRAFKKLKNIAP